MSRSWRGAPAVKWRTGHERRRGLAVEVGGVVELAQPVLRVEQVRGGSASLSGASASDDRGVEREDAVAALAERERSPTHVGEPEAGARDEWARRPGRPGQVVPDATVSLLTTTSGTYGMSRPVSSNVARTSVTLSDSSTKLPGEARRGEQAAAGAAAAEHVAPGALAEDEVLVDVGLEDARAESERGAGRSRV